MKLGIEPLPLLLEGTWWTDLLDGAGDQIALVAILQGYGKLAEDALEQATAPGFNWSDWETGLLRERRGHFAGEAWAERYGAILLPARLLEAGIVAERFKVPLGLAINRLEEAEAWR